MSEEARSTPDNRQSEATETPRDLRLPGALVRTALSSEQTLMSWVRTSLSMFTLGFAIAQFFQYLAGQQDPPQFSAGPRRLGIALICVGILVLLFALAEHVQNIRRLKEQGLPADSASLLPIGSAAAILAIGIAAFASVFLGWHL